MYVCKFMKQKKNLDLNLQEIQKNKREKSQSFNEIYGKLHNPVYFLDTKIINVRNCDNKNVNSTISA